MDDGSILPVLAASRTGYQNLCQLITRAKLRGTKTDAPVRYGTAAILARERFRRMRRIAAVPAAVALLVLIPAAARGGAWRANR